MGFKEWALANPTKTRDYINLQKQLKSNQESIEHYTQVIKNCDAGITPDWWTGDEPKPTFGSGLFSNIISVGFESMQATQYVEMFGMSQEEANSHVRELHRKAKLEQWEQDALTAAEDRKRRIEVAIGFERNTANHILESTKQRIKTIEDSMRDYIVDPEIFDYHPWRHYLRNDWQHIVECLNARLAPLGIGDFDESSEQGLSYWVTKVSHLCDVSMWNLRGWIWYVKLSSRKYGLTIIRQEYDMYIKPLDIAFIYALLSFLDQGWDKLITRYGQ